VLAHSTSFTLSKKIQLLVGFCLVASARFAGPMYSFSFCLQDGMHMGGSCQKKNRTEQNDKLNLNGWWMEQMKSTFMALGSTQTQFSHCFFYRADVQYGF
jgi:hypothetical protein